MQRGDLVPARPLLAVALWVVAGIAALTTLEIPAGSIAATVVSRETGRPIPNATLRLRALPPLPGTVRDLRSDAAGRLLLDRLPAGEYELEGSAVIHTLAPARLTVREGERLTATLEMEPRDPFLELNVHQNVFAPDEPVQVVAHGYVRVDRLAVTVFRLPFEQGLPPRLPWGTAFPWGEAPSRGPAGQEWYYLESQQSADQPIVEKDAEGVFTQRLTLNDLPPGLYVGEVSAEGIQQQFWFLVTELALIVKRWPQGLFVFVGDFRTGEPRPGVALTLYQRGQRIDEFRTDAEGMYRSDRAALPNEVTVVARVGDSLAFTNTWHWSDDERGRGGLVAHFYTDRPVYRPGDTVHYKAVLRRRAETGAYEVPDGTSVQLEVRDPRDTLVQRTDLTANPFGSAHGELTLPAAAATGEYGVTLRGARGVAYDSFSVAAYRKPEFTVTVQPERPRYVAGDTARATVTATYYFGAPVADAVVEYSVTRSEEWRYAYGGEEWAWYSDEWMGEFDGYGEAVFTGRATTDAAGRAAITFPTEPGPSDERDARYQVFAWVTDAGGRQVEGETAVQVTRGHFHLRLLLDRYAVLPNEPVPVVVRARDYDGAPQAGVEVRLELEQQQWRDGRDRFETVLTQRAATDAQGEARLDIRPPRAGYFRLRAVAHDARRNRIAASQWLWVTTASYADLGYRYPALEVVADRDQYAPGDTARLIINSDHLGTIALLAVEGDRLYEARRLQLQGKTSVVEVPIRSEHIPNIFATVSLLGEGRDETATVRLPVSPREKALTIRIAPDRDTYQPGETARVTLAVTDPAGRPVATELSLAVVDEAIYAIREEPPPDILAAFYPVRAAQVQTNTSYPRVYLSAGAKGEADIAVRRRFEDTALWRAAVVTDEQGEARLTFPMPDNLTTWRFTAVGHTQETLVGAARGAARTTKPLLVRVVTPRFGIAGDRFTVGTVVHNDTDTERRVEVNLQAENATLADATPQTATVAARAAQRFDWSVTTPLTGTATLTATVREPGGLSDGVEVRLPVHSRGFLHAEHRAGQGAGSITETFIGNARADPGTAALEVRLAPSLVTLFLGSLESLAVFPWGCIEQIMSGFLPDLVLQRLLTEQGMASPWLQENLPEMVREGLARIYDQQNDDGTWGWGRYDEGDAWMTAYVLLGLQEARALHFTVNETVFGDAVQILKLRLDVGDRFDPEPTGEALLLTLYALARAGDRETVTPWVDHLLKRAGELPVSERALLILTLTELGRRPEAINLREMLFEGLEESRQFASWPGGAYYRNTEATAWALRAALAVAPQDARLPKVVNWLLVQRTGGLWFSTRATSLTLLALAEFVAHTRELQPDLTVRVRVNGAAVRELRFTAADIGQPEVVFAVPADGLDPARTTVEIATEGEGRVYYNLTWTQLIGGGAREVVVTGAGLTVGREFRPLRRRHDPQTGRSRLEPGPPATRFTAGDLVEVHLILEAQQAFEFLLLEDLLPAGFEVAERGDLLPWEWGNWWADTDFRDDRAAFFIRRLERGRHELKYLTRVETPGDLVARAPEAWGMYDPALRARGRRAELTVRP